MWFNLIAYPTIKCTFQPRRRPHRLLHSSPALAPHATRSPQRPHGKPVSTCSWSWFPGEFLVFLVDEPHFQMNEQNHTELTQHPATCGPSKALTIKYRKPCIKSQYVSRLWWSHVESLSKPAPPSPSSTLLHLPQVQFGRKWHGLKQ